MSTPDQVYKTKINASADKVWVAITNPEFTKQYWWGASNVSDWKRGSEWKHIGSESQIHHMGKVEEAEVNKRLVITWHNPGDAHDVSRVTFEIAAAGDGVELTIIHGDFVEDSAMAKRVSGGWPKVVANMKEFLEKGCASHASGCAA